jgi:hypothetical protein
MRLFVAALVLAAVAPVQAHHPFTAYYDASTLVSLTGVVVEVRNANPHVTLIVDGTLDGRSGRWAFEGLPPNAFTRRGVDVEEKLRPGMTLTISGWPAKDPAARAFSGREVTFADGSKIVFGPTPQEGDRWSCGAGPCSYTYPAVPSK